MFYRCQSNSFCCLKGILIYSNDHIDALNNSWLNSHFPPVYTPGGCNKITGPTSRECGVFGKSHYDDVIMDAMASQITSLMIVYSTFYSGADQNKQQSSASLAFEWGIHRGPVNSPHKWPVTRKMFPFDSIFRLVSWINHLPPACWSTFWKSIFKQQLGCRCDILDSISCCFCLFWHMQLDMSWSIMPYFWIYLYFFNILYFF